MSEPIEPAVYSSVKIIQSRSEVVKVPEDLDGISAVAEWVAGTGAAEYRDVSVEGFRYRNTYPDGTTSRWFWVSPGEWMTLMSGTNQDPEFDWPSDYVHRYHFNAEDWVSGAKLHE